MIQECQDSSLGPALVALAGTLVGVVLGAFLQRGVRTLGKVEGGLDWRSGGTGANVSRPDNLDVLVRHLTVTFYNGKDVPVTVWEQDVVFYKGDKPLGEEERPLVEFKAEDPSHPTGGRALEPVNLAPRVSVTHTLRVVPWASPTALTEDPKRLQAVQDADTVEFVARMVGAPDMRVALTGWQDLSPFRLPLDVPATQRSSFRQQLSDFRRWMGGD